ARSIRYLVLSPTRSSPDVAVCTGVNSNEPKPVLQIRCWYLGTRLPKPDFSSTRCFFIRPSMPSCTARSSRLSTGSRLLFWLHAGSEEHTPELQSRETLE